MTYEGHAGRKDAPTPSTAASTPAPAWPKKGDPKGTRPSTERPATGPPGPRLLPSSPKRPQTQQTRTLGDASNLPSLGHTATSTFGHTGTSSNLASTLKSEGGKKGLVRGLTQASEKSAPEGRRTLLGTSGTLDLRMTKIMDLDSDALKKNLQKLKRAKSRVQTIKALQSAAKDARAKAIEAKCSPEVRQAFRSKPPERCGCATITAVWSACDTFWEFDTAHSGAITREAYINLMRECATVNTLRMLRRARLEFRFRRSAAPVLLEDFLLMIWPKATFEDRERMLRWAELRECFDVVRHNFNGTDQDLEKLFRLLSYRRPEGVHVMASELARAQLLPDEGLAAFVKERRPKEVFFDYEEFKSIVWPKLKERWITSDTIRKQKTVEEKEPLRVRIQRQTDGDHPG